MKGLRLAGLIVFFLPSLLIFGFLLFGAHIEKLPSNKWTTPIIQFKQKMESQFVSQSVRAVQAAVEKIAPDSAPALENVLQDVLEGVEDGDLTSLEQVGVSGDKIDSMREIAEAIKVEGLLSEDLMAGKRPAGGSTDARREDLSRKYIEMQKKYRDRFEAEQASLDLQQQDPAAVTSGGMPQSLIRLQSGQVLTGTVRMISTSRGEVHVDTPDQGRIILDQSRVESITKLSKET